MAFPRKLLLPFFQNTSSQTQQNTSCSIFSRNPFLADLFLSVFCPLLFLGCILYYQQWTRPIQNQIEIDFSAISLLKYTFFSMMRGLLAYGCSLIFSIGWGIWSAKDRVAEKALIPILDILQSIPILGFMPGLILLLIGIFPHNNVGLELASILMIFTSQAWNMAFGVYHSIRTVPVDRIESAKIYRFSFSQCLRWVEIPYSMLSLVWNSMMSMAGGWFFLMLSEAFQLGNRDFRLPGLGSYMSVAAGQGNISAMLSAILAMIALILFLDQFLWRPLVIWSQKFRIEDVGSSDMHTSWFLQVLTSSKGIAYLRSIKKTFPKKIRSSISASKTSCFYPISRIFLTFLFLAAGITAYFVLKPLKTVTLEEWFYLGRMCFFTFSRVLACLVIGVSIAVPLGLMIGLSDKASRALQPVIQVLASFPVTLLFPALIWIFHLTKIPLSIGSLILMLLGTFWYLLFNVIAGAKAIPSDFKEAALEFRFKKLQRWKSVYIPSIFPYLITGLITAAGGAWNASIVAEYVSYHEKAWTTPGIGSTISLATQEGNIPLLVASICVMASVVVLLNYQVWLRLYHYSEKHFALNS